MGVGSLFYSSLFVFCSVVSVVSAVWVDCVAEL